MITTTLNRIRALKPCNSSWRKLLEYIGKTEADDDAVPFAVIVEACGLEDAVWCCRAEPQHDGLWRLFAVRCARSVQHLMKNPRSLAALDVADRYANGLATDEELGAARHDAWAAARGGIWASAATGAAAKTAGNAAMEALWAASQPPFPMDTFETDFLNVVGAPA